jgi:hypothetical protein
MYTHPHGDNAGRTLLMVVLGFLVVAILAYRTMEHFQQGFDEKYGFSEEDAVLALPQFRLVDSMLNFGGILFADDPGAKDRRAPYLVLAGSFASQYKAEAHVQLLQKKGLKKATWVLFTGSRDIYAVAVSKHSKLADAQAEVTRLKRDTGIEAYVHKVRDLP